MPEGGPDEEGKERFLFVEETPEDEGKDELVVTISHLSLEEQRDQPAPKQTGVPDAETTEPPQKPKGRLTGSRETLKTPCFSCGKEGVIQV